ncbi:GNAT family N-acetyltransferase [Prolixibacter denitrificans]|uniref:Acetyltransferase (GNAT) family protein n=1 Tax=Prolixibacter denitrificans TaxID=1541063 RepID=A0A2P8CBJ6_9BACT|nr:GNAT family N-acetyltransferase [Prolixibacter denitrificans]PSK82334.1 acetyltransferase (GNAT) family protein [Prolixibacter denitrificans]GET22922.1 hypothetical protein JCM18694_31680 [Prolixibacter denitrificans]
MIDTEIFNSDHKPSPKQKEAIIDFLFTHLEKYGDPKPDIQKALDYSMNEGESFGGFTIVSSNKDQITGVVLVNRTGMKDYIPENILVYIATHNEMRGQGIGKALMQKAIDEAEGDIALHVEPDNPAKFLYEKFGFTNKYLEMRYKRNGK